MEAIETEGVSRRRVLTVGAGGVIISLLPISVLAATEDMQAAVREMFGDRPIVEGGVSVTLPPIAENGFSVPISVHADSPMTQADHVRRIAIFSPRNPLPDVVRFELGPRAGRASVSTRIRLSGTQKILVVAEMSDGTLRSGAAETLVTLAACILE